MQSSFVAELAARRHAIKSAWERRLRNEPVTSPLANPETLVLLMDRTLDNLLAAIAATAMGRPPSTGHPRGAGCLCGLNPLLAYYRVGAAALATVVGMGTTRCAELDADVYAACLQEALAEFQGIAQREIKTFCAMCQTEIARGGRPASGTHALPAAKAGK